MTNQEAIQSLGFGPDTTNVDLINALDTKVQGLAGKTQQKTNYLGGTYVRGDEEDYNQMDNAETQAMLSQGVDQQIFRDEQGNKYQSQVIDGQEVRTPFEGKTRRLYMYGTDRPEEFKLGLASGSFETSDRRYIPEGGYGWEAGEKGVDLGKKQMDFELPYDVATTLERKFHYNEGRQQARSNKLLPTGQWVDPEMEAAKQTYGAGMTEYYKSVEAAMGVDPTKKIDEAVFKKDYFKEERAKAEHKLITPNTAASRLNNILKAPQAMATKWAGDTAAALVELTTNDEIAKSIFGTADDRKEAINDFYGYDASYSEEHIQAIEDIAVENMAEKITEEDKGWFDDLVESYGGPGSEGVQALNRMISNIDSDEAMKIMEHALSNPETAVEFFGVIALEVLGGKGMGLMTKAGKVERQVNKIKKLERSKKISKADAAEEIKELEGSLTAMNKLTKKVAQNSPAMALAHGQTEVQADEYKERYGEEPSTADKLGMTLLNFGSYKLEKMTDMEIVKGMPSLTNTVTKTLDKLPKKMAMHAAGNMVNTLVKVGAGMVGEAGQEAVQSFIETLNTYDIVGGKDLTKEEQEDIAKETAVGMLSAPGAAGLIQAPAAAVELVKDTGLGTKAQAILDKRKKVAVEAQDKAVLDASVEDKIFVSRTLSEMIDRSEAGIASTDLEADLNTVYRMQEMTSRVSDKSAGKKDVLHNLGVMESRIIEAIENLDETEEVTFGSTQDAIDAVEMIMETVDPDKMTGKLASNLKRIALANGVTAERFQTIKDTHSVEVEATTGARGYKTYLRAAKAYMKMDNPDKKSVKRLVRDTQNFYDSQMSYKSNLQNTIEQAEGEIRTAVAAKEKGVIYKIKTTLTVPDTKPAMKVYIKKDDKDNWYITDEAYKRLEQKTRNAEGAKLALDELGVQARAGGKVTAEEIGLTAGIVVPKALSGPKARGIDKLRDEQRAYYEKHDVNKIILNEDDKISTEWKDTLKVANSEHINVAKYDKNDVVLLHTKSADTKAIRKHIIAAKKAGATIVLDKGMSLEAKKAITKDMSVGVKYDSIVTTSDKTTKAGEASTARSLTFKPKEVADKENEGIVKTKEEKVTAKKAKGNKELDYLEATLGEDTEAQAAAKAELVPYYEGQKSEKSVDDRIATRVENLKKSVIAEIAGELETIEVFHKSEDAEQNVEAAKMKKALATKYEGLGKILAEAKEVYGDKKAILDSTANILVQWKDIEQLRVRYDADSEVLTAAEKELADSLGALSDNQLGKDMVANNAAAGLKTMFVYTKKDGKRGFSTSRNEALKKSEDKMVTELPVDVSQVVEMGTKPSVMSTIPLVNMGREVIHYAKSAIEAIKEVIPSDKEFSHTVGEKQILSQHDYAMIDSPARALLYSKTGDVYTLNENVVLAMKLVLDEQIANDGYMLSNKPKSVEDIARMLGIEPHAVDQETRAFVNELGMLNKSLSNSLGQATATILGIKRKKGSEVDAQVYDRLLADLGQMAVAMGIEQNLLERQEEKATTYARVVLKKSSKELEDSESTVAFIRQVEDSDFEQVKRDFELVSKNLPDTQINRREGSSSPINKKVVAERSTTTAKDVSGVKPAPLATDALKTLMEVEWEADLDGIQELLNDRHDIELGMGYIDLTDAEASKELTLDQRETQESKNRDILKSLDELELLLQRAEKEGSKNSMSLFYEWVYIKNGRYMMDSNTINPQVDKLHRFLVQPKDHKTTYDVKVADGKHTFMHEGKDVTGVVEYAIAQAFGYKVDKLDSPSIVALAQAIMQKDPAELRNIMIKEGESEIEVDGNMVDIEAEHVAHTLQAINFMKQMKDGGQVVSSLSAEYDAVTSGFGLKLMQMPILRHPYKWLVKVGIVPKNPLAEMGAGAIDFITKAKDDKINVSMNDFLANGTMDSYQELASKIKGITFGYIEAQYEKSVKSGTVKEVAGVTGGASKKLWSKLGGILPQHIDGEDISTSLRTMFKDPFMTFNYSAGLKSIRRSLSSVVTDKLITDIMKSEKGDDVYQVAEQIIGSLSPRLESVEEFKELLRNERLYAIRTVHGSNLEIYLNTLINVSYGSKVEEILSGEFKEFMEAQETINTSFKALFQAFKVDYDKAVEAKRLEKGMITPEDKMEIVDSLRDRFPAIKSPLAVDEADVAIYKEASVTPTGSQLGAIAAQTKVKKDWKPAKGTQSWVVWHKIKDFEEAMSSGSVVPIHYIDGSIMATTLTDMKGSGIAAIHDAIIPPLVKSGEAQQAYNRGAYEISKKYSLVEQINDTIMKSLAHVADSKDYGVMIDVPVKGEAPKKVSVQEYVQESAEAMQKLADITKKARSKLFSGLEDSGAWIMHLGGTASGVHEIKSATKVKDGIMKTQAAPKQSVLDEIRNCIHG